MGEVKRTTATMELTPKYDIGQLLEIKYGHGVRYDRVARINAQVVWDEGLPAPKPSIHYFGKNYNWPEEDVQKVILEVGE